MKSKNLPPLQRDEYGNSLSNIAPELDVELNEQENQSLLPTIALAMCVGCFGSVLIYHLIPLFMSGGIEAELATKTIAVVSQPLKSRKLNQKKSTRDHFQFKQKLVKPLITKVDMPRIRPWRKVSHAAQYQQSQAAELLDSLLRLNADSDTLTLIKGEQVNWQFEELRALGIAAVSIIAEFLEDGIDLDFTVLTEEDTDLGYRSLRMGLIDTLSQIGGAEALEVLNRTLHTTTEPSEIGLLANSLEHHAPGIYHNDILQAAKKSLNTALGSQPNERPDLKPLFPLFQNYGDTSVVLDLEQGGDTVWRSYTAAALARLPEGAGVPSLIRMVADPDKPARQNDPFVLAMLAQSSRKNPEAGQALVDLAESGQLSSANLTKIASYLGGKEVALRLPLSNGTDNIETDDLRQAQSPPGSSYWQQETRNAETWSVREIDERIGLIDQFLETNQEPETQRALQSARFLLSSRRTPQQAL